MDAHCAESVGSGQANALILVRQLAGWNAGSEHGHPGADVEAQHCETVSKQRLVPWETGLSKASSEGRVPDSKLS